MFTTIDQRCQAMAKELIRRMAQLEIPEHCRDSIVGYVIDGADTGGFLSHVFANDLAHAAGNADSANYAALGRYGRLMIESFPDLAFGSVKKVQAWRKVRGYRGWIQTNYRPVIG